jgi:hypothetical protein
MSERLEMSPDVLPRPDVPVPLPTESEEWADPLTLRLVTNRDGRWPSPD